MTRIVQLLPARWRGGPQICPIMNLPAFPTVIDMREFHKLNGPRCKVLAEYQCVKCGHWHMETSAPDPTGASSGMGRSSKGI